MGSNRQSEILLTPLHGGILVAGIGLTVTLVRFAGLRLLSPLDSLSFQLSELLAPFLPAIIGGLIVEGSLYFALGAASTKLALAFSNRPLLLIGLLLVAVVGCQFLFTTPISH